MNNFTVGEIVNKLKIVAQNLEGKKVNNYYELCENEIEMLGASEYPLINEGCRISINVLDFGKIGILELRPIYRTHKGRRNGVSEYLDHVEVVNILELPLDLDIENVSQKLRYDRAAERKCELQTELEEMKKQVAEYEGIIKELDVIMKTENYQ